MPILGKNPNLARFLRYECLNKFFGSVNRLKASDNTYLVPKTLFWGVFVFDPKTAGEKLRYLTEYGLKVKNHCFYCQFLFLGIVFELGEWKSKKKYFIPMPRARPLWEGRGDIVPYRGPIRSHGSQRALHLHHIELFTALAVRCLCLHDSLEFTISRPPFT